MRSAEGCELAGHLAVAAGDRVSAPIRMGESDRRGSLAEIEKQRGAVVDALDRLFVYEIPTGESGGGALSVWSGRWGTRSIGIRSARGCAPSSSAAVGIYGRSAATWNCSPPFTRSCQPGRSGRCEMGVNCRRCGATLASTGRAGDQCLGFLAQEAAARRGYGDPGRPFRERWPVPPPETGGGRPGGLFTRLCVAGPPGVRECC